MKSSLPYSLFSIQVKISNFPGTHIYITDNIDDLCGGILFSFVLVYLVSPLQAIMLSNLPLIVAICLLCPATDGHRRAYLAAIALVVGLLVGGLIWEHASLAPAGGKPLQVLRYRHSRGMAGHLRLIGILGVLMEDNPEFFLTEATPEPLF